ncbi:MAG: SAM-dependent chlorinase/fluorinase [Chloroflexi bacterium]|nr:SAM-dependent chlorinase/fluorinase [Chloroflexota bacterium]
MQPAVRPFISFLTDFGPDAAAAICRGVMLGIARDAQIVDISHSIRKYAIRDGAYLLWITLSWLPVGVHVAVVDPGVGTARRPIGIQTARGDVLIGPDNGLLWPAAKVLGGALEARVLENRAWMLPKVSTTFHGRDIFSPMAANLAIGGSFKDVGPQVDLGSITALDFPEPVASEGQLDTSVVYIASFGNLHLAGGAGDLARALGPVEPGTRFTVELESLDGRPAHVEEAPFVRTFGETSVGTAMLYEDSFARLGYADNQGDAARRLGARLDQRIRIRRA